MRTKTFTAGAVALLCAIAAVRVFLYCAAFPFFNNVDEQAHFDLVCKYSHGHVPKSLENFSRESAEMIALQGSPEYLHPSGKEATPLPPAHVAAAVAALERSPNHEATQPPVYYAVAGGWCALGRGLGLQGGSLLYWIRFLNVPLIALLVWLAYFFLERLYPENAFLYLGVPLLLSFFPQDVFYSINNDVLSAIVAGGAFYCVLGLHPSESRSHAFCALAGFLVAGAFLVKLSNVALLAVLAVVLALEIRRLRGVSNLAQHGPKLATASAAAALPIAAWLLRNRLVLGDWSGSGAKVARLGWTVKPLDQLLDHPIFTVSGLAHAWSETVVSFWRGEFVWRLVRMASDWSDRLYSWSSFVFVAVTIFVYFATRPQAERAERAQRFANGMSLLLCAGTALFLLAVSIAFDFGGCWYPSRDLPYMTSGRLALGALIPFLALYLQGLDRILSFAGIAKYRWITLGILVGLITFSEAALTREVFASAYNWFHLR